MKRSSVVGMVGALCLAISGCGMDLEEPPRSNFQLGEDVEVLMKDLNVPCAVQVNGYGSVPMEEYVASVVACENGNAPPEALKAQAVAARTYATFIMAAENRALEPTTRDQVYNCSYATVTQAHRDAAESTAGQVLTHGEVLLAAFYVAGAVPSNTNTCRASGGDSDQFNTERYVTYNQGRIGGQVQPSSLGHPGNRANRGAKSQNGSACLANAGWDYQRILRFYYGDDATARVAEGSACAGDGPPPIAAGDICSVAAGGTGGASSGNTPGCVDPASTPTILPRSAWNARAPRGNRPFHTPNRITVHHTVTPNNAADGAHWVRQAQRWHMDGNGWSDIGYHFLISWDGTIYRGNPEDRQGAHARNANSGNLGIALIGRFDTGTPSAEQIASLTQMLRYLGDKYTIDLNRNNVKGHGEWQGQSTACPGTNLRNQLDAIVEASKGAASCQGGDTGAGGGHPDGGPSEYRYVRVTGVSDQPTAANDVVDGFEVDAIYVERFQNSQSTVIPANRVACSAGVNNPAASLGHPDNTTCENRPSTVAGVPTGASLIVELSQPMREGDQLFVTQHMYPPGPSNCSPTGTAQIAVSADGRVWKVLDPGAQGNWAQTLSADSFIIDENDEANDPSQGFEVISPRPGHWYTPSVTFTALATNPAIATVEYLADTWKMGDSSNRSNNFRMVYEFQNFGERIILARGLDAQGNVVAEKEFTITVTDFDGTIPADRLVIPPLPDASVANSAMAETLAQEGGKCYDPTLESSPRCNNGTGGYSTGQCWRFVKRALERAGINYHALQNAGPCSSYTFQLSAYGFRCNADPNPAILRSIGLERIDVAPQNAPRGAVISWQHGCNGFHSQHGHIEISMGDGVACSDYCGAIRAGGSNCASVYVPVSN